MTKQNFFKLTELSCLKVAGVDAREFLHSQLTIDMYSISDKESRLGAYCDSKGRVISTMVIGLLNECFYLLVPGVLAGRFKETLLRYRMRAKVDIYEISQLQVAGFFAGQSAPELQFPHPLDSERYFTLLAAVEPNPVAAEKWKLADINCAMVWLNQHSSLKQLPQSLGLVDNGAVDFDKGCYPGQEIVARLKYLGTAKSGLYKVSTEVFDSSITNALSIRDGNNVIQGQLLNTLVVADTLTALAVIKKKAVDENNELLLYSESGEILSRSLQFSF